MNPPHKILIIRFSSIGDIVLTSPVIRCLRKKYPKAKIHYLTKGSNKTILEANPYIDKIQIFERSLSESISSLKQEKYDLIVDLHKNLRTMRVRWALRCPCISFDKLNLKKWLLVNFGWNRLPDLHIVDRYLYGLTAIDVSNDGLGLEYFIPAKEEIDLTTKYGLKEKPITFCIGGKFATKKLPVHKMIEIVNVLGGTVLLLGGPEDLPAANKIASECFGNALNLCGELSLNQSASVVKQSSVIVTHDTGMMHIAAAFNRPIVSIWGNTIPEFGMYPYRCDSSVIIEHKKLNCRPCSKIGFDKCPKGHFKCMEEIAVEEVQRAVSKLLVQ